MKITQVCCPKQSAVFLNYSFVSLLGIIINKRINQDNHIFAERKSKIHKLTSQKGYNLENKFELIEDFQSYKPVPLHLQLLQPDTEMTTFSLVVEESTVDEVTDAPTSTTAVVQPHKAKWGPKEYQTSNHPLKLMVIMNCIFALCTVEPCYEGHSWVKKISGCNSKVSVIDM